ncbi:MAG: 16S rRNA (cytidine(1402)-2'-O)-methyltransferase [Hymenobacteraceae bacterium]|nr:16S rRNA (cytidine(1402)-2'-O)-methyltransferase [Hymenobacteraceae bacterium]
MALAPLAPLTLVPVPIGNLEDITLRALRVLRDADAILCEDTRTTGQLLHLLGIEAKGRLLAHHQHNEHRYVEALVARLEAGQHLALVSDAGTPAISDPGFLLVRAVRRAGLSVECLPGPTAFVPALVQSGLPADRFTFEGFLPPKKGRQTRLRELAAESRTLVFYESPHRLARTLTELATALGPDRPAAVCRELTKLHEETRLGSLTELADHYTAHPPKGEIVVIVQGKD